MSHGPAETPTLYGLMAEFDNPTALVEATTRARLDGYRNMDAFTPIPIVRSQLALSWGVETFLGESAQHTDEMVRQVDEHLLRIGLLEEGELVVIIAGSPPGIPGSTNALRIHRMGDAINEVAPAYRRRS